MSENRNKYSVFIISISLLSAALYATLSWEEHQKTKRKSQLTTETRVELNRAALFPKGVCTANKGNQITLEPPPPSVCNTSNNKESSHIAKAICSGLKYLAGSEKVFIDELILGDFLARKFGAMQLSDFWPRYLKMLETESNPKRVKQLATYSRIADAGINAGKIDFKDMYTFDSFTMQALYCNARPLPDDYQSRLETALEKGGKSTSHVLLAIIFLKDLGCTDRLDPEFSKRVIEANLDLIRDPAKVNDLTVEVAAFLSYLGESDKITSDFLNSVLDSQNSSGSWNWDANTDQSFVSVHTTVLALWYLYENLYPQRKMSFVSPCMRTNSATPFK